MKFNTMKFSITIIIFVCYLSTQSTANDIQTEFPNYANEFGHQCKDEISLNFSNVVITSIGRDFISSPLITCLNLTRIGIQNIHNGAFNKLPNLTQLFLSNNNMNRLFSFGGHENLKVLILNSAHTTTQQNYYSTPSTINITEKYPNLEVLSLRKNYITDMQTSIDKEIPFPKLKILDLSGNNVKGTDFLELLPNSLYFLDLCHNAFASLAFDKKQVNLLALNLDNNNLKYVKKAHNSSSDLYNPHDQYNQYNRNYGYNTRNDQYNPNNPRNFGLAMTGLEKLHYLSLSGNKIDFIESNAFEDMGKLVYLNLSVNNINYLHPETFKKLLSMRSLDLSLNKLEEVPRILSETTISILSLNCNNIKSLIANAFVEMPKLTKLLLAGNQIVEINVKAFARLSLLEVLDLSKNKLSFLPNEWSESLASLKYLNLNDNQFASLESLFLTSALSLTEVNLMRNSLKYLDVSYFKNLPQNLTVNLMQESSFFGPSTFNRCK